MKARIIAAILLLGVTIASYAQEDTRSLKGFSLEAGTGLAPLHTRLSNTSWDTRREYAQKGQEITGTGVYSPSISLAGVFRTAANIEHTVTLSVAWTRLSLTQYSVFGTDPQGQPRYDLEDGTVIGTVNSPLSYSITWHWRYIWNPQKPFKTYTALGAGLSTTTGFVPLPSVTPIGVRFGGTHFYFFAEWTLGPVASFVHGGLGWKFF